MRNQPKGEILRFQTDIATHSQESVLIFLMNYRFVLFTFPQCRLVLGLFGYLGAWFLYFPLFSRNVCVHLLSSVFFEQRSQWKCMWSPGIMALRRHRTSQVPDWVSAMISPSLFTIAAADKISDNPLTFFQTYELRPLRSACQCISCRKGSAGPGLLFLVIIMRAQGL